MKTSTTLSPVTKMTIKNIRAARKACTKMHDKFQGVAGQQMHPTLAEAAGEIDRLTRDLAGLLSISYETAAGLV